MMTFGQAFAAKGIRRPLLFACGVAFTIYQYEGVPCAITKIAGWTVEFSTQSIFHGKGVTIIQQIKTLLGPMGFDVTLEPKVIRCKYDPKVGL